MSFIIRNIPNAVTCCNILAGTASIICAFRGTESLWGLDGFAWAYIFIGIAAVADFLDGFMARLLHAYSDMGKELDSLCDLVSFGVAPAMILFNTLEATGAPVWLRCCSLLIPAAGALRLARFNIDTRQTTSFIGLPIPANAIFWIGFSAAALLPGSAFSLMPVVLAAIIILSWLMLAPLPLFSLKFKSYGWNGNRLRWILILSAPLLIIFLGVPGLMWLIILYLLLGIADTRFTLN